MSKKSLAVLGACFLFALGLNLQPVSAKSANNQDVPDQDGTYDIPGNPNLKVRVFVHNPKPKNAKNQLGTCPSDIDAGPLVHPAGWHLPSS